MLGRKKPYTAIGISRVKCAKSRCEKPGESQWQCCALANRWFPLCREHDVELNELACTFLMGCKAKPIMTAYRKAKERGRRGKQTRRLTTELTGRCSKHPGAVRNHEQPG